MPSDCYNYTDCAYALMLLVCLLQEECAAFDMHSAAMAAVTQAKLLTEDRIKVTAAEVKTMYSKYVHNNS